VVNDLHFMVNEVVKVITYILVVNESCRIDWWHNL